MASSWWSELQRLRSADLENTKLKERCIQLEKEIVQLRTLSAEQKTQFENTVFEMSVKHEDKKISEIPDADQHAVVRSNIKSFFGSLPRGSPFRLPLVKRLLSGISPAIARHHYGVNKNAFFRAKQLKGEGLMMSISLQSQSGQPV
eukprot:TRINITY_DN5849_c0_g1_i1.p1 TRINITY_DN5849_c0_g1~~TRINITY_DN5849_c0_g1_i1.p1  ORF type:complete len:146 (-),score=12.55 TRINITY_DN5849_c0_g1_i1:859-1296(-)